MNPDHVRYTVYDVDDYLYGWDAQEEDLEETECNVTYNESKAVNIKVGKASLPEASDLRADKTAQGVELSWTAPDVNVDGMRTTDSFEDYEPFSIQTSATG